MDTFAKKTSNNVVVKLWETKNGYEIGSNMQICHRGFLPAAVAFLVWGEIEIFDFVEVFELIKQARKIAKTKNHNMPGVLRERTCKTLGTLQRG